MFLSVHATAGMLIGLEVGNPILGFILGVISHFVIDAIPHGDECLGEMYKKKKYHVFISTAALDLCLTIFLLFNFFTLYHPINLVISLTILGAVLPDLLTPIEAAIKWRIFRFSDFIHDKAHQLLGEQYKITIVEGAVIQLIFWLLIWGQISSLI